MKPKGRRAGLTRTAIAIALLIRPLPVSADAPCQCNDIAEIEYRIREDDAVIKEYERYGLEHTHTLNTKAAYASMQSWVQGQLDKIASSATLAPPLPGGEQALTGRVDGKCITVWPTFQPAATSCLHEALDRHEAVHRKACEEGLTLTLIAKAQEEIDAYTAEKNFLTDERSRLLCNCDYYALKLEETANMDFNSGMDHQVSHMTLLGPSDQPSVQFPLQISNGAVSGTINADMQVSFTDTGRIIVCNPNVEPTAGTLSWEGRRNDTFEVSGTMSHAFTPELKTTTGDFKGKTSCVNRTSSTTPPLPKLAGATQETTLSFTRFNDVFVINAPTIPSMTIDAKATLVVNDKWKGVRAADNRGSTVDQALAVIGLCDCPGGAKP